MYPIAVKIGSLAIHWYGIMAACGFMIASWLLERNREYAKLSKDQCGTLLIIAMIAGILGARIFYVVQFFHQYKDDLIRIFYIHEGGLVFYGGFILAFLSIIVYTRKNKLDTIRVLDIFAPAMAAAHCFGRIGCFLNGCCFGRATDAFWGVTAPAGSILYTQTGGLPVHPVQLLEAGENLLLCFFYCWLLKKGKRGTVVASYLLIYGILRCINETLRGDNVLYWHLTPAQWIGALLITAGAGLLCYFYRHEKRA
ncbi:MAG: prolipoprotein diacylglyceryl transferase [Lentisphaerae bacterium]|nr:prolipoprotein diacylglyceryl transferase [Lentisphaerota bacterium]